MERKSFAPYLILLALLMATAVALAFTVDVKTTDEAGIRVFLPDQVGEWTGHELRFCQNFQCQKEFAADTLEHPEVCPVCGGALDSMARVEKEILPPDTQILKKKFEHPDGRMIFVAIVMSGKERASIHRPEVCLAGQGYEIVNSEVLSVPMEGRRPLEVKLLDLVQKGRTRDGRTYESNSYYAYWFVGKGRETPRHLHRMFWMAYDRIVRNVSHRWAYISLGGGRRDRNDSTTEDMSAFLRELYPTMAVP